MHPFQFQLAGKLLVRSYMEANNFVGLVDRYDLKMMGKPCFILHLDKEEIGSDQRCRVFLPAVRGNSTLNFLKPERQIRFQVLL